MNRYHQPHVTRSAAAVQPATMNQITDAMRCHCAACTAWLTGLQRGVEGVRQRMRAVGEEVPAPRSTITAPTTSDVRRAQACGCNVCQATLAGLQQGAAGEKINHRQRQTRAAQRAAQAHAQRVAASLQPPQAPWQPSRATVTWQGVRQQPWEDATHYIARAANVTRMQGGITARRSA